MLSNTVALLGIAVLFIAFFKSIFDVLFYYIMLRKDKELLRQRIKEDTDYQFIKGLF